MAFNLFDHQKEILDQLKTGSILCGGVGSGKSLAALAYYYIKECGGKIEGDEAFTLMESPKDLYIITTAGKRDTLDWERECSLIPISKDRTISVSGVQAIIDSWNNIWKYTKIKNAFFIFDEQRVVGHGAWVKSFIQITKQNNWILLTATPGDNWMDYIPVFIANGFYKNRTEFLRSHVVYNTFTKYPKVDRYVGINKLERLKKQIIVIMNYTKPTISHFLNIIVKYDKEKFDQVYFKRWNPFKNKPVKDVGEFCHIMRKVVNSDPSRLEAIRELHSKHRRIIVFYNFDYELDILRKLNGELEYEVAEYNGHKHEPVPKSASWIYLVQYISGAEGWNCIETNTIIFFSQNYSYRIMKQASGRIDRLNTPFTDLYYYTIKSLSPIDLAISKCLLNKKDFNERLFIPM